MNITKKTDGTTLVIALDDRLDSMTAPQLEEEIRKGFDGVETLIFDFSDLEYITSAGLRMLLKAQRMMYGNGNMKVIHANDMVKEVFNLTGSDFMLGDE